MASPLSERDWQLRAEIYAHFVTLGRPPSAAELARERGEAEAATHAAFQRLHTAHQILLDEAGDIMMANPLAGRPTDYAVYLNDERRLWANCAWDALGVSALLAQDARVVAGHPNSGAKMRFGVVDGELRAPDWLVHFALPFRRWYDDLVHT